MTESTPAIVPASKKQDFDNPMTDADIHEMWGGDEGRAVEISSREVRLIARIDFEKVEKEKAQAEVARLNDPRILTCAFCGEAYPIGTPAAKHEALVQHISICPDHPMAALKSQLAEAQARVKELEGLIVDHYEIGLEVGSGSVLRHATRDEVYSEASRLSKALRDEARAILASRAEGEKR